MPAWPRSRHDAAGLLLATGLVLAGLGMCTSVPLVYAGYAAAAAGALIEPGRLRPFLAGWPWAAALAAWLWLSTALSPYPVKPLPPGFAYGWPALAVWALAASAPGRLRAGLWALAGGAGAALALGLAQFTLGYQPDLRPWRLSSNGLQRRFASGFYSHWIRHADALAMAGSWAVALAAAGPWRGPARWAGITAAAAAAGIGVLCSGARGAVPALVAGIWGALAGGGRRRAVAATALALGLGALLAAVVFAWYPERMAKALRGEDGRAYIWQAAWQAFLQHPLTGVGHGAYDAAATAVVDAGLAPRNPDESPAMGNAHNSYLSLLVLHGVPGLVLWGGWLGSVLLAVWRRRHAHPAAWPVALATVMVILAGGMTEDLAAYASSRFQLFFGLALALGLAHQGRDGEPSPGT